ncbi:MAG: uroporphyrinogen-III decarboxylase-like protein [Chloroflexi bacterium]|nr:uroporphyrinogen-III decarboxylase-like protein [Chloroflexota bacterium]
MFEIPIQPDYEALLRNLRREGTPQRVHYMELFLDREVHEALHARFGTADHLDRSDPYYDHKAYISLYRFLGYDTVTVPLGGLEFPRENVRMAEDTATLRREEGRRWADETRGVIASWEDFERYPWPDPARFDTSLLEWYSAHVPDDMCLVGSCHNVFEEVTWLMGYQPLCYALYDQPDLVDAMFERIGQIFVAAAEVYAQFDRVKILFGGDDMGYRSGTMVSAQVLIEKALPWHKKIAQVAHESGKLYLLHSCGNLEEIMPALIEDVKIDGKHSFEDTIEPVTEAKRHWGDRIALIGGIDVDFLTRATPEQVRQRVRETLDVCLPGGGYCLGSGNSVTNYIPLENYLAMMDEGRRYTA